MASVTELRYQLSDIEADESTYAQLGPGDALHLEMLLHDEEAWMAARAVYALARIDTNEARTALVHAADNPRAEVRVATAAAARHLPQVVSDTLLDQLLDDPDVGVRKFAIRSVSAQNSKPVQKRLREIAETEDDPALKTLAEVQIAAVGP